MKLTDYQMDVMCNILAAVETGGQVYGQGRWDDFTEAGKNSANEKAITIGCYQFYGTNAQKLLNRIRSSYPAKFKELDTAGIASDLDHKNWAAYKLSKTSDKAKCIQRIIGSQVGITVQKSLMAEQITTYINRAATEGVTEVQAAMFCANIQHLGGKGPVQRIIKKTGKPLTIERIYAVLKLDQQDTSNNNQVGDPIYWSRHVKVYGWIKQYIKEDGMTKQNAIDKLISVASAEVGYLEKKSNSQLDSKTANAGSNNYTKYARDYRTFAGVNYQGQAWCDMFVDWCFVQAFGKETARELLGGGFSAYTPTSAQYYKNKKQWHSTPQAGDQVFFHNSSRICHTGIVYRVSGNTVYTIEGNTSGASGVIANGGGVCKKSYALGNSRISGYGRPDWSLVTGSEVDVPTTPKGDEIYMFSMKTVKRGETGTHVLLVQEILRARGYKGKDGKALELDRSCGDNTVHAITAYQKDREKQSPGICGGVDGVAGEKTLRDLIAL